MLFPLTSTTHQRLRTPFFYRKYCIFAIIVWVILILNHAVQKELDALEPDLKARFLHICELLETFGPSAVGMPHVRHLTGKLWEMRMNSNSGQARAIYLTSGEKKIVVVTVFTKKSPKTPRRAIDLAIKRAKELDL